MTTIAASRSGPSNTHANEKSDDGSSHPYTCNSCQVAFRSSDLQRSHMRTDWHRYNLKRRVASLPPLSSEIFAEKVLTAQATSSAVAAKASFEKICTACQKSYYSENAFQNHLGSQKHRLRAASHLKNGAEEETASVVSSTISLGDPIPATPDSVPSNHTAEIDHALRQVVGDLKNTQISRQEPKGDGTDTSNASKVPISPSSNSTENATATPASTSVDMPADQGPIKKCLFCNYMSPTFKLNVMHMTKYHSMFIPEQQYLVDLEGLISWLNARIQEFHECLYCHKTRNSPEAIQTHMRDVGHCKIAFEEEEDMLEVGQFYDFTSTYSDPEDSEEEDEEEEEGKNGVPVSDSRKVLKTVVRNEDGEDVEMAEGEENGEGWETDSSASSVDTAEITAVPIDRRHMYKQERLQLHRHHSHDDPRPHRNADGFHSHAHAHHAVFHSDHELHLPSGRTAGHRSLNRYYRQNLHNHPSAQERIDQQRSRLLENGQENDEGEEGDNQVAAIVAVGGTSSDRGRGRGRDGERQLITRADGGLGMLGVSEAKKKEASAEEKRSTKRAQRAEKQYQWGLEKRGNSQKHFRDPLLQ